MAVSDTSLEELEKICEKGDYGRVPIVRTLLSDIRTPVEVLRRLKKVSGHTFLLESAEDARIMGRYTFLGFDPRMEISCKDHVLKVICDREEKEEVFSLLKAAYREAGPMGPDGIREEKAGEGKLSLSLRVGHPAAFIEGIVEANRSPKIDGLPTLTGGLVGYFAYDYIRYGEPELKLDAPDEYGFDDVNLMLFDRLICFDNYKGRLLLIADCRVSRLKEDYRSCIEDLDRMEEIIREGEPEAIEPGRLKEDLAPSLSEERFKDKVAVIKDHIREGDIFQLVFSDPQVASYEGSLFNAYRVLRTTNPSPYMFYFSGDDVEIAGASPETLVKVDSGEIMTFPLAGTRPRGKDPEEDRRLSEGLLKDPKELAEHNMLVDLGRNDLGRLCRFGSVKVARYMDILRYSHVMHIGSAVKGTLRGDVSAIDTVDSVLPAGTLSGAPKFKACQLINDLEGDHRGIYGGAIGYVDFTGNLDVSIAIRLAVKRRGKVFVRSGAGIVYDSVPKNEYQECLNKARAVTEALKLSEEVGE